MKKIFAQILAMLMVVGLLAACDKNEGVPYTPIPAGTTNPSDPTEPSTDTTEPSTDPTEPSEEFSDELLDWPEEHSVFFLEYNMLCCEVEHSQARDVKGGFGVYNDDEVSVFYIWDSEEGYVLYEINAEDEILRYIGDVNGENFEETTYMTQNELRREYEKCCDSVMCDYINPQGTILSGAEAQYKKVASEVRATGKAYKYEVHIGHEYYADIWIDEDTGFCVELHKLEYDVTTKIVAIDTTDARLPDYK